MSFFSGVRLPPPGLPLYLSPLALQKDAAAVPNAGGLPEGRGRTKTEKPQRYAEASAIGWRRPTFPQLNAVSSALRGLTSLFGMGRGGPPRYSHHVYLDMSLTWSGRRTPATELCELVSSFM